MYVRPRPKEFFTYDHRNGKRHFVFGRATIVYLLPRGIHCIYLKPRDHKSANSYQPITDWLPPSYITSNIYNMSGRVVSDIQTRAEGESLYIWYNTDANVVNDLWNSLVLCIFWRSNFENTSYITRENQSYSLCKSTKICIAYTDAFTLMISFVFSSWIINEFHKINYPIAKIIVINSLNSQGKIENKTIAPFWREKL